jgi:beta-lactamase class A
MSGALVRAHFDSAFLAQVSPAMLNQALQGASDVRLVSIGVSEPGALVAVVSIAGPVPRVQVALTVDRWGLISGLRIGPVTHVPTPPATWAGVGAAVRSVAPQVRLLVANVTSGSCQPVHSIGPATPAPLGSAFKLYVLDALGAAVASGKVGWNQPLTITAQLKSLPSGELQTDPDGTRVPVRDAAAKMISISDNTAASMLINLVGRPAVEAALTAAGMADPALDRPFLTTRELFILKLDHWPALAKRNLAANEAARRALLATTIDRAPLPSAAAAKA